MNKIKIRFTCDETTPHSHKWRWSAWLCNRWRWWLGVVTPDAAPNESLSSHDSSLGIILYPNALRPDQEATVQDMYKKYGLGTVKELLRIYQGNPNFVPWQWSPPPPPPVRVVWPPVVPHFLSSNSPVTSPTVASPTVTSPTLNMASGELTQKEKDAFLALCHTAIVTPSWSIGDTGLGLTIRHIQQISLSRSARWHAGPSGMDEWSIFEWVGCMAGEAGEALNWAKKLKRLETSTPTITIDDPERHASDIDQVKRKIMRECADTLLYSVLVAYRLRSETYKEDFEEVVRETFNKKSEEYGFPERL